MISVATFIDVCCFCAMASVFSLVLLLVASSGAGLSWPWFFCGWCTHRLDLGTRSRVWDADHVFLLMWD
jgi:hypothetical protein